MPSGRLGDQRKMIFWVDYNDSYEKRVRSCLKVSKSLENHTTFSNIFWSEVAMLGANRWSSIIEIVWCKFQEVKFSWLRLTQPPRTKKYSKIVHDFPCFYWLSDNFGHVFHTNRCSQPKKWVFVDRSNVRWALKIHFSKILNTWDTHCNPRSMKIIKILRKLQKIMFFRTF